MNQTKEQIAKICSKCGKTKLLKEFHQRKDGVFGRVSRCKECTGLYQKEYSLRPEVQKRKSIQAKVWKKQNKEHCLNRARTYEKERKKNNIQYKLAHNLRGRLYHVIKDSLKTGSAVKDLGCSTVFLKTYLEELFYSDPKTHKEMNWENYGVDGWHIDHIKPLSAFDLSKRNQFLEACRYTNLQPLWAKENLFKSNKLENS